MKKLEMSEVSSNLLLFFSVAVSVTPFLLGDRLHLIVAGFVRDGLISLNQIFNNLVGMLS
jgi:hypothetical protein